MSCALSEAAGASGLEQGTARRLDELEVLIEKKLTTHDQAIAAILSAIRQLTNPPTPKQRPIGFIANLREDE